jgi:hypothetical protein
MRLENVFLNARPIAESLARSTNAEFHDLVLQQPQGPACASLGRFGAGQGDQLGFLLTIENSRYRWRREARAPDRKDQRLCGTHLSGLLYRGDFLPGARHLTLAITLNNGPKCLTSASATP